MEASMSLFSVLQFLSAISVYTVNCALMELKPNQVLGKIEEGCVFILLSPENETLWNSFVDLSVSFPAGPDATDNVRTSSAIHIGVNTAKRTNVQDYEQQSVTPASKVTIGYHKGPFLWNGQKPLLWKNKDNLPSNVNIAFFHRKPKDRSCLLQIPQNTPKAEAYDYGTDEQSMIDFLNSRCNAFQTAEGELTAAGKYREHILRNVFHVSEVSNVTMEMVWQGRQRSSPPSDFSHRETKSTKMNEEFPQVQKDVFANRPGHVRIAQCERLPNTTTKEEFFHNYLTKSKPFVLEGAVKHWKAFSKWTQEFLSRKYGEKEVHIKLAPNGIFEGVEDVSLWEDYNTFQVPPEVLKQLYFPDLVVVRPGTANIKFSEFVKMMNDNNFSETCYVNQTKVSAYLEYSSVRNYFKELEEDVEEFDMMAAYLQLRHLNIWLSDGDTLGKLHFDPYDNLLCQIRGKKQLTLFEPHRNTQLYEAHIPEALLGYNNFSKTFRRKTLLDSTSMVMAPVDILNPDFKRFPEFAHATPLNCTINEGDALFMPAFWWHEVQSYPNETEGRNLAINYWYEPFLQKEFPCQECKLDVNPAYRHLLRRYA